MERPIASLMLAPNFASPTDIYSMCQKLWKLCSRPGATAPCSLLGSVSQECAAGVFQYVKTGTTAASKMKEWLLQALVSLLPG